jgi:hypothetical protein
MPMSRPPSAPKPGWNEPTETVIGGPRPRQRPGTRDQESVGRFVGLSGPVFTCSPCLQVVAPGKAPTFWTLYAGLRVRSSVVRPFCPSQAPTAHTTEGEAHPVIVGAVP